MKLRRTSLSSFTTIVLLAAVLFGLMARDQGFAYAGVLLLAFMGVLAQGVALAAVVVPCLRGQRPTLLASVWVGICVLLNAVLLVGAYNKAVWSIGALSVILASAIVLGTYVAKRDESKK